MTDQEWKLDNTARMVRIETLLEIFIAKVDTKASQSDMNINRRLIFLLLTSVIGLSIKVIIA